MADSTTLETLSLEVNASSKNASDGISSLINPLRSMARGVGTATAALREMNRQMKILSGFGNLKLPKIGEAQAQVKAAKAVSQAWADTHRINVSQPAGMPLRNGMYDFKGHAYRKWNFKAGAEGGFESFLNRGETTNPYFPPSGGTPAKEILNQTAAAEQRVGKEADKAKVKVHGLFSQIGKIAKMMLIRTAVRSLIRAFTQSYEAAYQFSKSMGGSFANSMDAAKTILADTATTLIQTFAPVLQALVPAFKVVGDSVAYLCTWIQKLLNLFGLTSDLMGKSVSSINKYYGATEKAGKSQKNLLASWDQLNVIQSQNSGSGGTGIGGYTPGSLKNLVDSEVSAILQILVGEGLLAVGMILACTGHLGLGLGMMAIGAGAIAKTLTEDWGALPKNVQNTITDIMIIAGGAMLALGVILLFSGAGTALGIGMILAGGANLAAAVALNWNTVKNKVTGIMTDISDWFVEKWTLISGAVSLAWDAVSKWWEENVSSKISKVWNGVTTYFKNLFGNSELVGSIAEFANEAWNSVSTWWSENVTANVEKEGVWGGVKGFFRGIFEGSDGNGGIKKMSMDTYVAVSKWWDENVTANMEKEGVWGGVKGFFSGLFGSAENGTGIAGFASKAWESISDWWNNSRLANNIKTAWNPVSDFFKDLWGSSEEPDSIAGFVNNAWTDIVEWWNTDIVGNLEPGWNKVTTFFKGIWEGPDGKGGIKGFAESTWESVSVWWTKNVSEEVQKEGIWGGVKGFFQGIFTGTDGNGGILGFFNSMWEGISVFWGDNVVTPIKKAWETIANWFYNNVTAPISNFFIDMVNGMINAVNWIIDRLNNVMNFTIPALELPLIGKVWDNITVSLGHLDRIENIPKVEPRAVGAYGIPRGDLFIANEAGAELVGSMNGKTTVANQGQIIEGIQKGVRDANTEQNELLRRQNELLTRILEQSGSIEVYPSADWGKFNQRSAEMWSMATGR